MILSVVDMRMGPCPWGCVERFAALGLRCCQDETDARPSMVEPHRHEAIIVVIVRRGSMMAYQYMSSSDVSGGNLLSGVVPSTNLAVAEKM
ncbi:hypothetical protein ZWY2020_006660 [Hordeum vulgare]|nr:hypothetical protein ZWY2020_006660 [Hordeum vulgare]